MFASLVSAKLFDGLAPGDLIDYFEKAMKVTQHNSKH